VGPRKVKAGEKKRKRREGRIGDGKRKRVEKERAPWAITSSLFYSLPNNLNLALSFRNCQGITDRDLVLYNDS